MLWNRSLRVRLVFAVVAFLVTIQFLVFSNTHSNNSPTSCPFPFNNCLLQTNESLPKSDTSETVVTKWVLTLWSFVVSDGRSAIESKERTDILLLLRKLVIFSVRETNLRLEGTSCTKWWVNPLSVTEFEQKQISQRSFVYNVTFRVQPGEIPFESILSVRLPIPDVENPFPASEISLLHARRLDITQDHTSCSNVSLTLETAMICLCPDEKAKAEQVTATAREAWSQKDPELPTWPPNVSMSVPDYVQFYTMDLYLKTPSYKTEFCGPAVKMLLFISSAPTHFHHREEIRNTFGNYTFLKANGVRLLFLFGTVMDQNLQSEIDQEFMENDDIVQADFGDSYHNLTLSHLSMYNWVVTHCRRFGAPMPNWILKADDDFFLNIPLARRIAEANPGIELMGVPFCGTLAIRNEHYIHKYYVPRYMHPPDYYPGFYAVNNFSENFVPNAHRNNFLGYLSGVAYLIRTDVLEPLLNASRTVPITHMDDAYVMGLLTREVGIRPQNSQLISIGKRDKPCGIRNTMSTYITNTTLGAMWTEFQEQSEVDCPLEMSQLYVTPHSEYMQKACLYI